MKRITIYTLVFLICIAIGYNCSPQSDVMSVTITNPRDGDKVNMITRIRGHVLFPGNVPDKSYVVIISIYAPDCNYHLASMGKTLNYQYLHTVKRRGQYVANWDFRGIYIGEEKDTGRNFELRIIVLKSSDVDAFTAKYCGRVNPNTGCAVRGNMAGVEKYFKGSFVSQKIVLTRK